MALSRVAMEEDIGVGPKKEEQANYGTIDIFCHTMATKIDTYV